MTHACHTIQIHSVHSPVHSHGLGSTHVTYIDRSMALLIEKPLYDSYVQYTDTSVGKH